MVAKAILYTLSKEDDVTPLTYAHMHQNSVLSTCSLIPDGSDTSIFEFIVDLLREAQSEFNTSIFNKIWRLISEGVSTY